ncbi:hypothetical protein SH661x_001678 [Planctomicrobium sp. SH661]|uniref:hypothetical protein n=1 Tax=Planctomicrobium sp. SH661 TaxID=3448124 RepID=UPI003F5B6157
MSTAPRIVDPYPQARETLNSAYEALIAAAQTLKQDDLSPEQKRELAEILAGPVKEISDLLCETSSCC